MSKNMTLKIMFLSTVFLISIVCLSFARTDHRGYRDSQLGEDCLECHVGSGVMNNHGAFFAREHSLLAQKAGNNCADCHEQSYCLDCHNGGNIDTDARRSLSRRGEAMPRTHRSHFISIHPIKAADDPQSCFRCHESKFCSDCHLTKIAVNRSGMSIKPHSPIYVLPGVTDPRWNAEHAADARRNLQSCQGCHPQKADCTNFACHPTLGGR